MRLGGLDLRTSKRGLGLSVFNLLIALGGTALGVGRGRLPELGSGTKQRVRGGRLGCSWGSLQPRDRLGIGPGGQRGESLQPACLFFWQV